jgi:hypothetical protein
MPNHLINETSPYLLQHAENPVNWYPWGAEALEKARREDKPIFLSIGYAACHWCHVMAHESFENPATAAIMNEHFINIKVDREERPDLDGIYMQAVTAMTGQGGWPMSVFLTPEGKPFYGGTYFSPVRRYNRPSFSEVLLAIARLWREDRPKIIASSVQISEHIQGALQIQASEEPLQAGLIEQASLALAQAYDWKHGGWGSAPRFPQPMAIEFLLRQASRGDRPSGEIAIHALGAMARGGMYDLVGGGFARYSTDDLWLVPHFEKMLYDNAQLALAYLHGYLVSGRADFRRVCEETLDFLVRELRHPAGGFYSSLDADSEGEEGKFYLWSRQEIQAALAPDDFQLASLAYGLDRPANFEGKFILQRLADDERLAAAAGLAPESLPERLKAIHQRLLEVRWERIRPATDDKVLTAWNALALIAFAEAARYLARPDYLAIAQANARFLLDQLVEQGRLLRAWRAGQARHSAYLEDHAALILGLLALYQSDSNPEWYSRALWLANEMQAHYRDPQAGFFDTRDDAEALLFRPKDLQDNATPCGNSLAACALLQLAAFEGKPEWRAQAENNLAALQAALLRYPTGFAQWLQAADFAAGPVQEIALLGEPADPASLKLWEVVWKSYRPRQVVARTTYPPLPGSPALLKDRPLVGGKPAAYVCRDFVCLAPVTDPAALSDIIHS